MNTSAGAVRVAEPRPQAAHARGDRARCHARAVRRTVAVAQAGPGDAGRQRQPRRHGCAHLHAQPVRAAPLLRARSPKRHARRGFRRAGAPGHRRRGTHARRHRRRQHASRRDLHAGPAVRGGGRRRARARLRSRTRPTARCAAPALGRRACRAQRRPPTLPGGIAARRHGLRSASQEAALAFPVLFETAVPALAAALARGLTPQQARLDTLFHVMAVLDDSNLAHRGGLAGLRYAQRAARVVPGRRRRRAARRAASGAVPLPTISWRGACRPAARPTRSLRPAGSRASVGAS